ncbi:MAG: AbgT family transporter [Planctomycetota bacterium]
MSEQPPAKKVSSSVDRPSSGWFAKFLAVVEWLGNCLPHPVTLFALFALGVYLISGLAGWMGWEVTYDRPLPGGDVESVTIQAKSLMTGEGFRWIVTSLVTNFTGFVPLGTVLVALLGVAVAERSGLLSAAIRGLILAAPPSLVTVVVVLAGVLSNTASEMGYVVIIPLAMVIFHSLGRHPLAGLAAAFAGVSGGYSANLLIGTVDPLLAGITEEAAAIVAPGYEVHAAVNWYFMQVSVILITVVGTFVTVKIVEPRLGTYDSSRADESVEKNPSLDRLKPEERRGLLWALVAAIGVSAVLIGLAGPRFSNAVELPETVALADAIAMSEAELAAAAEMAPESGEQLRALSIPVEDGFRGSFNGLVDSVPGWGVLRNPETGGLMPSPFLRGVVAMIFVFFLVPGFVYGWVTRSMRSETDVIDAMAAGMSSMGLYIVLVFFAAQFVAFFKWTSLGEIMAVLGAEGIKAIGLDNPLVFIPFILMCCFVNLMLGSASAQWAATAPIFVPMLMKIGYSPEVIQAAYRIGDSTTNIITPMMSYFGLILAFAARYDKKLGIGTLVATMLPYSILFLLGWMILFYVWVFLLGLPVGPGAATEFDPAAWAGTAG